MGLCTMKQGICTLDRLVSYAQGMDCMQELGYIDCQGGEEPERSSGATKRQKNKNKQKENRAEDDHPGKEDIFSEPNKATGKQHTHPM